MLLTIKSIGAVVLVLASSAALAAPGNINRGEALTVDMGAPVPTTLVTDQGPPPPQPESDAAQPQDIWAMWAELLKFRESAGRRRR